MGFIPETLSSMAKIAKIAVPLIKDMRDPKILNPLRDQIQKISIEVFNDNWPSICQLPIAKNKCLWDTGVFGGHAYLFVNRIASTESLFDRASESFQIFMGKKTQLSQIKEIEGQDAILGFRDKVFVPDSQINFIIDKYNLSAEGFFAITTSEHALSGILAHLCVKSGSDFYMVRLGAGRYPIPLLAGAVDFANCYLGKQVWQTTDWVADYTRKGPKEFHNFYGNEPLNHINSLLEANSMAWALPENWSSDGNWPGNLYGSSGPMLNMAVGFGFVTRGLQDVYLSYINKNAQRNWLGNNNDSTS